MAEPLVDSPRYAIYFAPAPNTPWWRFGADVLGLDADGGAPSPAMLVPAGIGPDQWRDMTIEARRYGFHATLKAPFRLSTGTSLRVLMDRISALAGTLRIVPLGRLEPTAFPGFVALAPAVSPPGLAELAARCVLELDDLRAPLQPSDIARRQPDRLDARGLALLHAHGYPLVLERFRFHMTLANCTNADQVRRVMTGLAPRIAELNRAEPAQLDRICLFEEPAPGAALRRLHDWVLAG